MTDGGMQLICSRNMRMGGHGTCFAWGGGGGYRTEKLRKQMRRRAPKKYKHVSMGMIMSLDSHSGTRTPV